MKRKILYLLVWIALIICLILCIWSLPNLPAALAQAITPTLDGSETPESTVTPGQRVPYIIIYTDGSWDYAPVPSGTPTPETFTPIPTDTSTPTLTPGPTATPIPLCQGTTTASLNFRAGPGTSYAILQDLTQTPPVNIVFPKGAVIPINGWTQTGGAIWLKTVYKAQAGWVSAAYVTLSAGCAEEFPDYPF